MGRPAGHATRALRLYTGKVTRMRCVSLLMTNKSIISELCHMVSACFSFLAKSLDIQRFDAGHDYKNSSFASTVVFLTHLETYYEKMRVMH